MSDSQDPGVDASMFPDIPPEAFSDDDTMPADVAASAPDNGRPRVGETRAGEPSQIQILNAALNVPCEVHVVELEGESYPIVDLTNTGSDLYLSSMLPLLSDLEKSLAPKAIVVMQSLPVLNLFRSQVLASLREMAQRDDISELYQAFLALEIKVAQDDLLAVQKAAQEGKGLDFIFALAKVAWNTLGDPLKAAFGDVSVAAAMGRILGPTLMNLVVASLGSSLRRRGIPYTEAELRDKLELMDKFDQWNVVYLQYQHYQESGKLARFFGQSVGMATKSTNTATPSGSTTGTTPS